MSGRGPGERSRCILHEALAFSFTSFFHRFFLLLLFSPTTFSDYKSLFSHLSPTFNSLYTSFYPFFLIFFLFFLTSSNGVRGLHTKTGAFISPLFQNTMTTVTAATCGRSLVRGTRDGMLVANKKKKGMPFGQRMSETREEKEKTAVLFLCFLISLLLFIFFLFFFLLLFLHLWCAA
ncbi:hypothetical protein GGI42DRAFT_151352 [Trichoderma sp. SZMC 28013]